MPRRFQICAALCVVWWAGLVWTLAPVAAFESLRRHGPDAAIDAPAPSNFDFYRSNEDVQADSVLRQRRLIATRYVDGAQGRLDRFTALAVLPPIIVFVVTALIGWLPEADLGRPAPGAAPQPAKQATGRRRVK
jgi:hypothetical protein